LSQTFKRILTYSTKRYGHTVQMCSSKTLRGHIFHFLADRIQ